MRFLMTPEPDYIGPTALYFFFCGCFAHFLRGHEPDYVGPVRVRGPEPLAAAATAGPQARPLYYTTGPAPCQGAGAKISAIYSLAGSHKSTTQPFSRSDRSAFRIATHATSNRVNWIASSRKLENSTSPVSGQNPVR